MQCGIRRVFAIVAVAAAASGAASAQVQGSADWDATARELGNGLAGPAAPPGRPAGPRDPTLEQLNKYLSVQQLSARDRSNLLGLRAFVLSRAGREVDSQKDVAEMGKVLPDGWQITMWRLMPELAGGGDRGAALRTLSYALQRKPNDPWLLVAQAQVTMQIADYPRALGMLDGAMAGVSGALDRRLALYYRGQANFNLGNFQQAADDFDSVLADLTTPESRLDVALWRYAAQVHTRRDARAALDKEVGNENLYKWPGPVAKFLLGRMTAGELEVAAESDDLAKRVNGKCPAAFFVAMEAQRRGDRQRSREQLQLAQARCPTVSPFNWAASSELKRL